MRFCSCGVYVSGLHPKGIYMIQKIKSGQGWFERMCKIVDIKRKVDVYRNLNSDCWSVRQGARVVCHTDYITLQNCEFVVQPAGRRRVLIEQKKNVHAFVRGYLCSPRESDYTPAFSWDYVKYNPYKSDSFVFDTSPVGDNIKVKQARFVDMDVNDKHGVLAWGSR